MSKNLCYFVYLSALVYPYFKMLFLRFFFSVAQMVVETRSARKMVGRARERIMMDVPAQPTPPAPPAEEESDGRHSHVNNADPADPETPPIVPAQEVPVEVADHFVSNANSGNNNGNQESEEEETYVAPVAEHYITYYEEGHFPRLLERALATVGGFDTPLYATNKIVTQGLEDYYDTQVHIREIVPDSTVPKTRSIHKSETPHSSRMASVSNASWRALTALCYEFSSVLGDTEFRHIPRRQPGTDEAVVVEAGPDEDRLNVLGGVIAALSNDLANATSELVSMRAKLESLQDEKVKLRAQLAGREPPEIAEDISYPAESPTRKKFRYGSPGSSTRYLG